MAKQLKNIDGNKLGNHLEDYCNEELNERLRKFMVLDSQSSIEDILEKAEFTEITWTDVSAGIVVAEATLVEVNRVLKAQGIDFAFRRFDAIDYHSYMLVNTKENLKGTAQRVRSVEFKEEPSFS